MGSIQYITDQIRYMCRRYKGRSGGSEAEWRCQDHIQREMEGFADTVNDQTFSVHPASGWAWAAIVAGCCLVSIILPLVNMRSTALAVIAFMLSMLAVAVTVFEFFLGYPMIDWLFPRRKAKNVMASVKPTGKVKQRIVFTGHADAACEMTYSRLGGARLVLRMAVASFVSVGLCALLNTAVLLRHIIAGGIAAGSVFYWLRIAALLLVPTLVAALFFFNPRCIVDGANDNLSGCAVAMAALRELSGGEKRLQHTEVCCLITSSEECGLRGANAFAEKFAQQADGVDTVFVVLDTLRETQQLKVYPKGLNGMQSNSQEVARLIQASAGSLGICLPEADAFLGATDADALSRAGLKACALCGVDHTPQPYYHTREDHADNIDAECLAVSLDLCLEVAAQLDERERPISPRLYSEAI